MHLFVYGTLLSNIPSSMSKFLRRRAVLVGKATIPGSLHDLGSYPGYFPEGAGTVIGELWRLNDDRREQTLEMLDAYESVTGETDDEYSRLTVLATVGGGGTFSAETYACRADVSGQPLIPRGNYPPFYAQNAAHRRFVEG